MSRWKEAALGEVCELYQPKTIASSELVDDGPFLVYGANGVIGRYHSFNHVESELLVTCRGATCGAVNVSAPRSWINGNAMVVKPRTAEIELKFLEHIFRGGIDLSVAITGAAQPQITRQSLSPIRIAFPSLPEQRRIAAILDQADALRAKRREALAQLDSLTQSIFIEMFGDYRSDGFQWPIRSIEDIAVDMTIGLVRSAEQFGPGFTVPYVRMNAIGQGGAFLPSLVMRTEVNEGEFERYQLRADDLLFNTRNSRELVGKTAIFREVGPHVFNNNLMRLRFCDGVHPEYVAAAFQTDYIQQELEIRKAGTTSVFAIYGRELKTVPMPIPPFPLQQTFATRIQAVESLKATHRAALAESDALFASLQHRAFSGEL